MDIVGVLILLISGCLLLGSFSVRIDVRRRWVCGDGVIGLGLGFVCYLICTHVHDLTVNIIPPGLYTQMS